MRQAAATLEELGVAVLVLTFEAEARARAYVAATGLAWPLLLDETRALYHAYGMTRGRWWDIWGPATWRAYWRALRAGGRLRRPTGDVHQLGGDVLIDPGGVVRLHHVGSGPADRPAVETLLGVVRGGGPGVDAAASRLYP